MVKKTLKSSRRIILTGIGAIGLGAAITACSAEGEGGQGASETTPAAEATEGARPTNAEEAWQLLVEGNKRWAAGESIHPHEDDATREEAAEGQKPWAIVITCVDSRVAPELVFDAGIGDLMVVRTAGNIADTANEMVVESAVFGPTEFGTPLVVVMGHQKCGACTAAYEVLSEDGDPGPFDAVVASLTPAYEAIEDSADDGDDEDDDEGEEAAVDAMIRANVTVQVDELEKAEEFAEPIANGTEIRGAYYSLETGEVEAV